MSDPGSTDPESRVPDGASDRRRFLTRAGVAAGAAWVAPTVLSSHPAAAQQSPAGCALIVEVDTFECNDQGQIEYNFEVQFPDCAPATIEVYLDVGDGYGPPQCTENAFFYIAAGTDFGGLRIRVDLVTECGGTVIDSVESQQYGPCN